MNYNIGNYKKIEVETTDSMKLIIMLYEGAVNFLEQAKLRLDEGKIKEKGLLVTKVLAIIGELQSSLNMSKGGEVAVNMDRLYSYMSMRLMEANSENSVKKIDEILNHLRILKNAWTQARESMQHQNTSEQSRMVANGGGGYGHSQMGGSGRNGLQEVPSEKPAQSNVVGIEIVG